MLLKTKRFNIKETRTLKPKKIIRGRFVLLKIFSSPSKQNRAAVSIGKKISSSAATRNKIKRDIFKIIQKTDFLHRSDSKDLLIIPLPSSVRQPGASHVIIRELKELTSKL